MPSEAEWEYAIRAGTTTPFNFGETITSELANYYAQTTYAHEPLGKYRGQTTPVGSFPPNSFGLYDMHGQVWEWCTDAWHDNYQEAPSNGRPWTKSGKKNSYIVRGGAWTAFPHICRSAYRINSIARRVSIGNPIGFRVVCVGAQGII